MSIQKKTDWVDHLLGILCALFVVFCVIVVKEAKAHYDIKQQRTEPAVWTGPPIPKCNKELWLRITEGCHE